ncbi:hypothetical protein BDV96DRAFT_406566 [Lophiotrema nucula]|uniref:Uncharacterized protein n=1 Tax=Lophiotrema nucula TaxID=690887 RepID=A0A6A5ZFD1_9PLEO|nr:hypothetical protein BDV96DRAFT_406566 [Lophiotrema nucula]
MADKQHPDEEQPPNEKQNRDEVEIKLRKEKDDKEKETHLVITYKTSPHSEIQSDDYLGWHLRSLHDNEKVKKGTFERVDLELRIKCGFEVETKETPTSVWTKKERQRDELQKYFFQIGKKMEDKTAVKWKYGLSVEGHWKYEDFKNKADRRARAKQSTKREPGGKIDKIKGLFLG